MSAHTPGPWEASIQGGRFVLANDTVLLTGLRLVAEVSGGSPASATDNTHLISAAPELFESLKALVGLAERRGRLDEYRDALDVARAAIAKAEGR